MSITPASTAVARRLVRAAQDRGAMWVVRSAAGWLLGWLVGRPFARRPSRTTFTWDDHPVRYFHHPYHYTWLNERAVETALALEVLQEYRGKDVLEIGNVLGHYIDAEHLVVDKYEVAPGVVNADVADLELGRQFDLVLAVSTLEHVGLDEATRDPQKAARAVAHLQTLLKPGGRLWMTVPVDYNRDLDRQVRDGVLGLTRLRALRRGEHRNRWREVPVDEVWTATYDRLLFTAHGVVVGEYVRPS